MLEHSLGIPTAVVANTRWRGTGVVCAKLVSRFRFFFVSIWRAGNGKCTLPSAFFDGGGGKMTVDYIVAITLHQMRVGKIRHRLRNPHFHNRGYFGAIPGFCVTMISHRNILLSIENQARRTIFFLNFSQHHHFIIGPCEENFKATP